MFETVIMCDSASVPGPSEPKKPKQIHTGNLKVCEVENLLLSDFETDDDSIDHDDTESSSNDEGDDPMMSFELISNQPSILNSDLASPWKSAAKMKSINFTGQNIFYGPQNATPIDYFRFFFEEDFLQTICDRTNEQAELLLLSEKTKLESRITRWKELTVPELNIFLGLLFHMGTIPLSRIQDYWKTDRLFAMPIFAKHMSRNRFLIIMRCLHFTTETDFKLNKGPQNKIQFVIDYFNRKMRDWYYPAEQLTLDESMVLWQGRLYKHHKNGIKLHMLTEPDGLILRFEVSGIGKKVTGKSSTEEIVMNLLEDNLDKGHEVYLDTYYNNFTLAKKLLDRGTYCTGTLRPSRKNNPKDVVQERLEPGENISRFHEGVHVGKWKGKRNLMYITTKYPDRLVPGQTVKNENCHVKLKPEAVARYDDVMSGVDRQELLLSFYPFEKKTIKWYLKIAIHTFQLLFINSYKLYNKYSTPKMRWYDFRLWVINELLPEKVTYVPMVQPKDPLSHHISKNTEKSVAGRTKRKHCRQCYKRRKRVDTSWHCTGCPDKPGLCVPCFDEYHAALQL